MPTEITRQQALRVIFKTHCYTDLRLSVISTYIHGKAQRHLVDLLSTYYISKLATNTQEIESLEDEP